MGVAPKGTGYSKKASCVKLYLNGAGSRTTLKAAYYENGSLIDSEVSNQNLNFHGISYVYSDPNNNYTIKVLEDGKFKLMRDGFFNQNLEAKGATYKPGYNSGSIYVFFFDSDSASLKSCYDVMNKE